MLNRGGANDISVGLTGTGVGYGLPNTKAMLAKYADNDNWWKFIKEKRETTGFDWFMPSKDEFYILYNNKTVITNNGGDDFETGDYWSSSEYDIESAWVQILSNGSRYRKLKFGIGYCRLIRRI